MSADDHSVLIEIRERVARIETRQGYILELLTEHKTKMDRIEQEHQAIAAAVGLDNPINLLDTDWRKEGDFYDWLNNHYLLHTQIINRLGLT